MPHVEKKIELTLAVTVSDESTAARLIETLARTQLGLSAEDGVDAELRVMRFEYVCEHPEHDGVDL